MSIKRVLCVSDLHGCFTQIRNLLEKVVEYNPVSDRLIVLGDMIDRGNETMETVLYLSELRRKNHSVTLLMGNHEYAALQSLKPGNGKIEDMRIPLAWITSFGGELTIRSFGGLEKARTILIPFIESLPYYCETPDFVFAHGGIPKGTKNVKTEVPVSVLLNYRAMDYEGPHKTVICGHTVVDSVRFFGKHVVAIDTGCVFTGKLSAYDCLNKQVYWIEDKVSSPYYVGQN